MSWALISQSRGNLCRCVFGCGRGRSLVFSGIPGPKLECGRPLLQCVTQHRRLRRRCRSFSGIMPGFTERRLASHLYLVTSAGGYELYGGGSYSFCRRPLTAGCSPTCALCVCRSTLAAEATPYPHEHFAPRRASRFSCAGRCTCPEEAEEPCGHKSQPHAPQEHHALGLAELEARRLEDAQPIILFGFADLRYAVP